ncbi:multidrug resistance protein, MFS family [Legionella beliardensis]|uniref:Multidrug resistance protein, MFS family n=1 Tax=Legionella beliardensis TaxID=91822 RepID=A0A378HZ09_9GAMM|nr:MFS transporter [Legionella beliardensis]STX27526.1 multidrug resistance protein, MFS family [Legionella beliardensis]
MIKLFKSVGQTYYSNYRGVPSACWIDIFFNLLNAMSVGVCFFLSLYFVDELHFNMIIVGLLMSSYGIGTVVGGIVSGKSCDRYLPRKLTILSLILQCVAFFSLAWFHTFEWLITILFILGFSNYSFKTANNVSMLSHCYEEKRIRLKAINISHAASNLGLGISGIVVGLMASYGYTSIFYLASSILIFSAIYLIFFHKSFMQSPKDGSQGKFQNGLNSNIPKKKILALALLATFFVGMIIAQLGSTYPVYVKDAFPDLATKAVSILFILDTIIIVLFQTPLSNYYGHFNTVLIMGLGAFLMGLGMFILTLSSTFALAMISCFIWTTGEMLFIPTVQLLCYENGNKLKKGQSMGMFQSTYAISTVVGPTIGGFMYVKIGSNSMWYLSLIIGVVCLIFCISLSRDTNKSVLVLR